MKILITSPLYPPDISEPASHIKELAARLSAEHSVTVATYAHIPEEVSGVKIVKTSKRRPLLFRLISLTFLLAGHAKGTDLIYSENGASVELPVYIVSKLFRKPLLLHIGDLNAYKLAQRSSLHKRIHRLVEKTAKAIIEHRTPIKPEILPFGESVAPEVEKYEKEWERHIGEIEYHAKKYV